MVRSPCCGDDNNVKKGPWTPEEDQMLIDYIDKHGCGHWRSLPRLAGLNRCGKSCRLRWMNYLRPDIKRGKFTEDEERYIINLHSVLGNKWSRIATHLPGRTDNEIKNYWNTHIRKKLLQMGIDPTTHKPRTDFNHLLNLSQMLYTPQFNNSLMNNIPLDIVNPLRLQTDVTQLAKIQLLQNMLQLINTNTVPNIDCTNTLFGAQNPVINSFDQGLTNGHPNLGPLNPNPTANDHHQALLDSWTCFGGELKNPIAGDVNVTSSENSLGSSYNYVKQETTLPQLVSASPEISSFTPVEKKSDHNQYSNGSPSSDIFEAWEKLIDDDNSDSYWKNILELTSSSTSPIEW